MKPGVYNLDLYRGDSFGLRVVLWDVVDVTPVDLTGASVEAEIRDKSAGARIVPLGIDVTLPNIVDVSMVPDDWLDCPAAGVWDLQVTFPDGRVRTYLAGKVTTTGDVVASTAPTTLTVVLRR